MSYCHNYMYYDKLTSIGCIIKLMLLSCDSIHFSTFCGLCSLASFSCIQKKGTSISRWEYNYYNIRLLHCTNLELVVFLALLQLLPHHLLPPLPPSAAVAVLLPHCLLQSLSQIRPD